MYACVLVMVCVHILHTYVMYSCSVYLYVMFSCMDYLGYVIIQFILMLYSLKCCDYYCQYCCLQQTTTIQNYLKSILLCSIGALLFLSKDVYQKQYTFGMYSCISYVCNVFMCYTYVIFSCMLNFCYVFMYVMFMLCIHVCYDYAMYHVLFTNVMY